MNTQKGFSSILALLLVASVIGGGYYFYAQKTNIEIQEMPIVRDPEVKSSASTKAETETKIPKEAIKYGTYIESGSRFSFAYDEYVDIYHFPPENNPLHKIPQGFEVNSYPGIEKQIYVLVSNKPFSEEINLTVSNEKEYTQKGGWNGVPVSFGNTSAIKYFKEHSGASWTIYEMQLKDGKYLSVEVGDGYYTERRWDSGYEQKQQELFERVNAFMESLKVF